MTSPFQQLAQEQYSQNPKSEIKNPYRSPFEQLSQEDKYKEGFLKSSARTAAQIPQAYLETTTPGLAASLWQLLSMGEVLDPEEIEHIKAVSEREGIPFDENAYYEAAQQALGSVPTVANIAGAIEERTGVPLEPKEWYQKVLRLAGYSGKLQPGTIGQKVVAGTTAAGTSELLKQVGVPEPFAELAGLGVGGYAGKKAPPIDIGKATKPSGLPKRGFEKLTEPREISSKKLSQINEKLESDFKDISDKIIAESPIGETAEALATDPAFKQQSRELLNQAQEIADGLPDTLPTKVLKKELADMGAKKVKGYALNEYDKSYMKFMKEAIEDIIPENASMGELVEQYRKNNAALGEYFEPGASKALNRAKRDALLDHNRAIANVMEKVNPELSGVFKEGNARWTKIMDAETIDSFVDKLFENKVNFKKMHDFFDKQGYDRIFKRALGEKGYAQFEGLLKDILSSETPYKMLKVAKQQGWRDLFETAGMFILHPTLGKAKLTYEAVRKGLRFLMNSLLDKPQLGITWKHGVDNLKKGNFAQAEKDFEVLKGEVLEAEKKAEPKAKEPETVEVTSEKIPEEQKLIGERPEEKESAKSFTTEKGSTYEINEDGSTTRNKAYRTEHGEKEQGIQEKSEKTWFVTPEDANKLGEFQARGAADKRVVELPDGRLGVMYESGKDAGKVEARTLVNVQENPKKGLIPVESWNGGKKVHFGNKIVEIGEKPKPESKFRETAKKIVKEKKKAEPKSKESIQKISDEQLNSKLIKEKKNLADLIAKEGKGASLEKTELYKKINELELEKYNRSKSKTAEPKPKIEKSKTLEELDAELRSLKKTPQESFKTPSEKAKENVKKQREIRQKIKEQYPIEFEKRKQIKDIKKKQRNISDEIQKKTDEVENNVRWPERKIKNWEKAIEELEKESEKLDRQIYEIEKSKPKTEKPQSKETIREDINNFRIKIFEIRDRYPEFSNIKDPVKLAEKIKIKSPKDSKKILDLTKNIEELRNLIPLKSESKILEEIHSGYFETREKALKDIEKIKEVKRQDISPKGLKAQKKFIIDKIADALKHPEKYHADKIVFDVPGDGEFRIFNNPESLKKFEKHIVRNWPDKPLTEAATKRLRGRE